jgi:hypothetical protein
MKTLNLFVLIPLLSVGCTATREAGGTCTYRINSVVQNHWKQANFENWNSEKVLVKDNQLNSFLKSEFDSCLKGMDKKEILTHFGADGSRENVYLSYMFVDSDDTGLDSILCIKFWFDSSSKLKDISFEMGCMKPVD